MASTAYNGLIGWAQADVAVQNGTFSLVVDNFGRLKYSGGCSANTVSALQLWVASTIGSATPIRVAVLRVASKDKAVRWIW
jgi:hypothetical protein